MKQLTTEQHHLARLRLGAGDGFSCFAGTRLSFAEALALASLRVFVVLRFAAGFSTFGYSVLEKGDQTFMNLAGSRWDKEFT